MRHMNPTTVRRVVFFSALYDLLVTFPFATPWSARFANGLLVSLHQALALPGAPPSLADPTALLFANLMGSIVVVWSVLRLRMPTAQLGLADSAGRALFSCWMLFALLHGGSFVLVPLFVFEVAWGLVQFAVVAPALWPSRLPSP